MKVYIGPFRDWIGPYQIAEKLCFWAKPVTDELGIEDKPVWVHDFGTWLSEKTPLGKICNFFYSKCERKIKIKIHDYDTWNMDSTLAMLILPMLKQLKETKHGAPGDMPAFDQTSNSGQASFAFYEEGDQAAWDAGHAQWEVILNEMIWTFEQLQPDCDWEDQYWKVHPKLDMKKYPEDEGKDCVPVRWEVEGDCDWEGMRKHQERIQKGLESFGKHYSGLWD